MVHRVKHIGLVYAIEVFIFDIMAYLILRISFRLHLPIFTSKIVYRSCISSICLQVRITEDPHISERNSSFFLVKKNGKSYRCQKPPLSKCCDYIRKSRTEEKKREKLAKRKPRLYYTKDSESKSSCNLC